MKRPEGKYAWTGPGLAFVCTDHPGQRLSLPSFRAGAAVFLCHSYCTSNFFRDGLYGTLLEAISAMQAVLLCDVIGCSRCNALLRTDLNAFPAADALPGNLVTFWRVFSLVL